ncbi:MAG: 1-deoxy-D-xylulose-5-phosphate reductoisomerase [bacterium]|nr:1-deoxy-D-xylulose-5-phosphate reductoisomerase [bacterium]
MKRIVLLGATGSIGQSTIDVVENHRQHLQISTVVAKTNVLKLAQIAIKTNATFAIIEDETKYQELKTLLNNSKIQTAAGKSAILEACQADHHEIVLNALVGAVGVEPTLTAIQSGKTVALANKESLVCAGKLIIDAVKKYQIPIIPVDSEHSAIFQVLQGESSESIKKIVLTASGGPFRELDYTKFDQITPEQALKHPTWKMGKKVTIDSSTLVNKGLEMIEAKWLFDTKPEQLQVVIHPQSIIHSMVIFKDSSVKAQLSTPDMRLPIQYALSYPERWDLEGIPNDFLSYGSLTFQDVDSKKFPAISLAFHTLQSSSGMGTVLNAADEIAVSAFLERKIKFTQITHFIEKALNYFNGAEINSIEDFFHLDDQVRRRCTEWLTSI